MSTTIRLFAALLVLGLMLSGFGIWLLLRPSAQNVAIPEGTPIIVEQLDFVMRGRFDRLYIYEDGRVVYTQDINLRMPGPATSPTRIWRTGQVNEDEFQQIREILLSGQFTSLEAYYQFPGEPIEGGGFSMGDMTFTLQADFGDVNKSVSALGYLSPDGGLTYPGMPHPLNYLYAKLDTIVREDTIEVARQRIDRESSTANAEPPQALQLGEQMYYGPDSIDGNTLVLLEMKETGGAISQSIATYDLGTEERKTILELPTSRIAETPSASGDRVVWSSVDRDEFMQYGLSSAIKPSPNWDVFLLDLKTGTVQQITTEEHAQVSPRISGDTIVWLDGRQQPLNSYPSSFDIYALDLKTGQERRITSAATAEGYDQVSISGSLVVWTDVRVADSWAESHPSNAGDFNNEIYLYDPATGQERRITTDPANDHCPAIDGNRIVWLRQVDNLRADVFMYDLATGQTMRISHSGYAAGPPSISGNRIVWLDARASLGNTNNDVVINGRTGAPDIYAYDIATQAEMQLTSGDEQGNMLWASPVVGREHVVYLLDRQIGPVTYVLMLK